MHDPTRFLLNDVWTRSGTIGRLVWIALLPPSWLFAAGVAVRNWAYDLGVLRIERARIGVVSVGNLAVGGTGKTPIALWLAQQLAGGGLKVAIVLRGYGGRRPGVTVVSRGGRPLVAVDQVGDEAAMLARCFDGVVITAPRRIEGVCEAERLGCEVAVLDDGFQHRSLARDFDLVVIDGKARSFLPAGPLREGKSALRRADAVALASKEEPMEHRVAAPRPVYDVRFAALALIESDGGVWHERPLSNLSGKKVVVVSGIAKPASFYAMVHEWEVEIVEVFEYADHHAYTQQDWQTLNRRAHEAEYVVTTEKDLVKLEHFPFARGKLVALRIAPVVERGEELVRAVRERALHRSSGF